MASKSKIRKAIGVVKDITSIRMAQVAGSTAPELEILVVKATSHDEVPAEDRHVREIISLTSTSRGYVGACVEALSRRLSKTSDWIVALKSLFLVHRLLIDGDVGFQLELMFSSRRGVGLLNMSSFRDDAHSNSWDHSEFVRVYAMYVDQKLEFMVYERKLKIIDDDERNGDKSNRSRYEDIAEISIKEMKLDRIFMKMVQLEMLLDRCLSCQPVGLAGNCRLVLITFYWVVKESFKIYLDVCEVFEALLDRFSDMEYSDCVKTFEGYVSAAKQIDQLIELYIWCQGVGVARSSEFPNVQRISNDQLEVLEKRLKEKETMLKSNEEEKAVVVVVVEEEKEISEVEAKPRVVEEIGDLVNLDFDEVVSMADDGETKLALTLWEGFSEGADASSGWELALVESANNLSKQKTIPRGGFDLMSFDEVFDQGSKHANPDLSGVDKSMKPILALPAPGDEVQALGHDPFSGTMNVVQAGKTVASNLILPVSNGGIQPKGNNPFDSPMGVPSGQGESITSGHALSASGGTVQAISRQSFDGTNAPQLWHQYGGDGLQGQVGLSNFNGGSAYYAHNSQAVPFGTPTVDGVGQPGGYYYATY